MEKLKRKISIRDRLLILLVDWTKPVYVRWFKQQQEAWPIDRQALQQYPTGTLGRELGDFLAREGFELLPKLEDHDVLHVLLKYETTVIGEAQMQFFLLGNGKRSLYALFTALLAMLLLPEGWRSYRKAFRLGRASRSIANWRFEHLLREPIKVLHRLIHQQAKDEGVEAPLVL